MFERENGEKSIATHNTSLLLNNGSYLDQVHSAAVLLMCFTTNRHQHFLCISADKCCFKLLPTTPLFNSRRQKLCVQFLDLANLSTRRDAAPSEAFNPSRFVWISAEPPLCVFASQFPASVRWSEIILSAESKVHLRDCLGGFPPSHPHTSAAINPSNYCVVTAAEFFAASWPRHSLWRWCWNTHSGSNSAAFNEFDPNFYVILCH